MKAFIGTILLALSSVDAFAVRPIVVWRAPVSLSLNSAVPFLPDGYTKAEWQEEHEAELAQLQAREEEFIGHRGTASQPVRHLTEDLDEQTVVHFHKPAAIVSGSDSKSGTGTSEETALQKMRRRWGRDDDEVVP
mmetsp:Transcript_6558/g.14397  ORF Transcript_6558/g.14397 Transcript_6558/m.14397 type:complete len:135 (-) Transcript_6558:75-479(-)